MKTVISYVYYTHFDDKIQMDFTSKNFLKYIEEWPD